MTGIIAGSPWNEWVGAGMLMIGALLTVIAAVGVVRLPDVFSRMHAASKPQLLGVIVLCAGVAVSMWQWRWLVLGMAVIVLQVVTASTGSHVLARSAAEVEHPEVN
ncbi:monovalent cation/H(+) antiporter subunit G [Schaalia canis]|uniref:Monovalent cation/H(+) antiporter subunit G n=1 Tax=Schaalia canis TaxID=100469 RepID=A0A3P1SHM7_9ACTO|nr:monovalent cation/H(+) antiporter subunit G [Schaalia canis]RRC95822.1 monovalent cation/H(+) antiporter subunit G [Schaalia canis]